MSDYVNLDANPVTAAWFGAIRTWDTQIAELQEKRARAFDLIQQAMGDHAEARIDGKPVITWAWSKPSMRLDRKALEADLGPDTVSKYLVESKPARPFRILAGDE